MRFLFACCVSSLLLSGCAERQPNVYKVPLPRWQEMDQNQQQAIISHADTQTYKPYKTAPTIEFNTLKTALPEQPNKITAVTQHPVTTHTKPTSTAKQPIATHATGKQVTPPKPIDQKSLPADANWLRLNTGLHAKD